MWVIVAMSLTLADGPKFSVIPGAEYPTEAECVKATQFHADFQQDHGNLQFSVCVPKDSVQIGR